MVMTWAAFRSKRLGFQTQFFPSPGATRTVMFCSHIWWTEQMALALVNLGYNVLLHYPLYLLYTDDNAWSKFDQAWNQILATAKAHKVDLLLGGNTAALAVHPTTGEQLNHALGVPQVNYWWDEPRSDPPFARRGYTPQQYLTCLKDPRTLNVIWDIDVLEELAAFHGITNTTHVPLATLPEAWPSGFMPLEQRPIAACFLGNCHYNAESIETDPDPLAAWARTVTAAKLAALDRPMRTLMEEAGSPPLAQSRHITHGGNAWADFRQPWELVNSAWMHRTRNQLVKAAASHLKLDLALVGKGWDQLGLQAFAEHAGERSGMCYAQSRASLNLFGGCVHGGMPLRPFDIGASGGLIVTHYQRELPSLFEVGKECLAFRTADEMLALLDRIKTAPSEFNTVAQAGRRRVLAEHTWAHRMRRVLQEAERRFA